MILIGDCNEKIKEIPSESIHFIFTAPPWGDEWSYSKYPKIYKLHKSGCSGKYDFPSLVHELYRVLVPGGVLCWNVGDCGAVVGEETLVHARQALYFVDIVGFKFHTMIIFNRKTYAYEYIMCLSKGNPRIYNKIHDMNVWSGPTGFEEDVYNLLMHDIPITSISSKSPTWLVRDLLLTYTQEGDRVLDPFSGSGTTIEVSELLHRNAIGIEIDPKSWNL